MDYNILRFLTIVTTILIYLRRKTQLQHFFETELRPGNEPVQVDKLFWLLLGSCWYSLIRLVRIHQMTLWREDISNMEEFTIFLGMQLYSKTKKFFKAGKTD